MKITYERLVNLGNYNNERVALEDDVQPDETPEQAYARVRRLVYQMLNKPDPNPPFGHLAPAPSDDAEVPF